MSGFFGKLFGRSKARRETFDADIPIGDLKAGALYSIFNGDEDNEFGVVKILVLEPPIVHIRLYQNTFATRPTEVDPLALSMGGLNLDDLGNDSDETMEEPLETQGFGIGHMPVHLRDFIHGWQPVFLMNSPVTGDELEGYEIWKQHGGGVFGGL